MGLEAQQPCNFSGRHTAVMHVPVRTPTKPSSAMWTAAVLRYALGSAIAPANRSAGKKTIASSSEGAACGVFTAFSQVKTIPEGICHSMHFDKSRVCAELLLPSGMEGSTYMCLQPQYTCHRLRPSPIKRQCFTYVSPPMPNARPHSCRHGCKSTHECCLPLNLPVLMRMCPMLQFSNFSCCQPASTARLQSQLQGPGRGTGQSWAP